MRRGTCLSTVALLLVAATGCGSSESATTTTTAAPITSTMVTTPSSDPAGVALPGPGEPWDVLFLAEEDFPITKDVAESYRRQAAAALGVDVRIYDTEWLIPFAYYVLGHVRGERFPELDQAVRDAEIIILQAFPERSDEGRETAIDDDFDECMRETSHVDPQPPDPDLITTAEYWEPYRVLLDDLYTEIWRLREGTPTLLIGLDVYESYIGRQRRAGIEDECRLMMESWTAVMREAAEAHGAEWVSLHDLLNGPNHDLDPQELGWIGPTAEGPPIAFYEPNVVGSAMIADALAAVGFDPVTPPGG